MDYSFNLALNIDDSTTGNRTHQNFMVKTVKSTKVEDCKTKTDVLNMLKTADKMVRAGWAGRYECVVYELEDDSGEAKADAGKKLLESKEVCDEDQRNLGVVCFEKDASYAGSKVAVATRATESTSLKYGNGNPFAKVLNFAEAKKNLKKVYVYKTNTIKRDDLKRLLSYEFPRLSISWNQWKQQVTDCNDYNGKVNFIHSRLGAASRISKTIYKL